MKLQSVMEFEVQQQNRIPTQAKTTHCDIASAALNENHAFLLSAEPFFVRRVHGERASCARLSAFSCQKLRTEYFIDEKL